MTNKVYTTAKGKPVDMGALRLQNETIRAVGNMGVNARGDRIDADGNIIDPVNQQLQRRIKKQTNVSHGPVHSSQRALQPQVTEADAVLSEMPEDPFAEPDGPMDAPLDVQPVATKPVAPALDPVVAVVEAAPTQVTKQTTAPVAETAPAPKTTTVQSGTVSGLAAAIARSKTVKQELEKSPKQLAQDAGIRKL